MRIQRTSQLITVSVIVVSAISIVCTLVGRQFRYQQEEAYERRRLMFGYADQLAVGSDRLTAAIRAYAATVTQTTSVAVSQGKQAASEDL